MDLLLGSYGKTCIMDLGKTCYGEVASLLRTCHLCCELVNDTTVKLEVANLLLSCYRETGVMGFGLYSRLMEMTAKFCWRQYFITTACFTAVQCDVFHFHPLVFAV